MSCTTAVFTLMAGATTLGCAALYFHYQNITTSLKLKSNSLNSALSNLQEERYNLIVKNENLHLENVSQTVENERLNDDILRFRVSLERMENDNRLLLWEYKKLEQYAARSAKGINTYEV